MAEQQFDEQIQEFLDIRQPGIDIDEHKKDGFVLDIECDTTNYRKFPRVDDSVTYPKDRYDVRGDIKVDPKVNLPDYSGPFRRDLRLSDFAQDQLVRMLSMSYEYFALTVEAWGAEVTELFGAEAMQEIQTGAWEQGVFPHVDRILQEWQGFPTESRPTLGSGVVLWSPFVPDARYDALDRERLVNILLGSHEFFLLVIESWAAQVVVRHGLDRMFEIQWDLWSERVLPGVRAIKIKWMNITSNDVAAFMKDIQIDATSFPGKAFDMVFDMPEPDVGIMTFNKCCAVDQWEALGRPDILEKGCHVTCPASLIETAKMYHPNMKIDILAIPPRVNEGDVCCKWKLSMRDESDPEYVRVELGRTTS